jgi:hypothetical protein
VGAAVVASMAMIAVAGLKGRIHRELFGSKEPVAAVATLNIGELPSTSANALPEATATAEVTAKAEPKTEPKAEPPAPSPSPSPAAVEPAPAAVAIAEAPKAPAARETRAAAAAEERRNDVVPQPEAKKPSSLLVRASDRRSMEMPQDAKTRLADARSAARERPTDARALKAWATAAMHAGESREARRAAESWAVHDASAEPRLFLASALESSGRKREARAVLEEWLVNHPDSADAKRMLSRLGAAPEPAIKRGARGRGRGAQLHPPDPVNADE